MILICCSRLKYLQVLAHEYSAEVFSRDANNPKPVMSYYYLL